MSYARDVLGYCDEPSPGTAADAMTGVWCTRPIDHDGGHLFYGIDCWTEDVPDLCMWFALCTRPAAGHRAHPTRGAVPICRECDAKVEALS